MKVLEIKPDKRSMETALLLLEHIPDGVQKASMRAINRAVTAGRAAVSKQVLQVYTVKSARVKSTLSIKKASSGSLVGELKSSGERLALMHFQHRPASDTTGRNRKLIRVTVRKGKTKPLATGFKSNKLHGNIFTRAGRNRMPIRRGESVSVPQMIGNTEVHGSVMERMNDMLEQRLDHEVQRILQKGKA